MTTQLFKASRKSSALLKLSKYCALCALSTCLSTTASGGTGAGTPPPNAVPHAAAQQAAPTFAWRPVLQAAVANGDISIENQQLIDQLMTLHVEAFTGTEKEFQDRFEHVDAPFHGKDISALEFKADFWQQQDEALRSYAQWVWANELIRKTTNEWTAFYSAKPSILFQHIYDLCFKDDALAVTAGKIAALATQNTFPAPLQSLVNDLYTFSQYELLSTLRILPDKVISDDNISKNITQLQAQVLDHLNDEPLILRLRGMAGKLGMFQNYRHHCNLLFKGTQGRGYLLKIPGAKSTTVNTLHSHEPEASSSLVFNLPVAMEDSHRPPSLSVWKKRLLKVEAFANQVAAQGGVAMLGISDLHGAFGIYGSIEQVAQAIARRCPLIVVFSGDSAPRSFARNNDQRFESDTLIQFKAHLNHTAQGNMFYTFGNHDTQENEAFTQFLTNWQTVAEQAAQNHEPFGFLISNALGSFREASVNQALLPYVIDGNLLVFPICMNYANGGLGEHEVPVLDSTGNPVLDEDGEPKTDYVPMFTEVYTRALENIDTDRCERDGSPNNFVYTYDSPVFRSFRQSDYACASTYTTEFLKNFGLNSDDDDDDDLSVADELAVASRKLWEAGSKEAPGKLNPITEQTARLFTTGVHQLSLQNPDSQLTVVLAAHDDHLHLLHSFEESFFLLPPQQRPVKRDLERMRIYAACGHMHQEYAIAKYFNIFSKEGEWVQVPSLMVAPGIYGNRISLWNLGRSAHLSQWTPQAAPDNNNNNNDDDDSM